MLFDEQMLTLDAAGQRLPVKRSKSTLYRWCTRGVRGIKLEHRAVGRCLLTSLEAIERFSERLANVGGQPKEPGSEIADVPATTPTGATSANFRRAQEVLERVGIRRRIA